MSCYWGGAASFIRYVVILRLLSCHAHDVGKGQGEKDMHGPLDAARTMNDNSFSEDDRSVTRGKASKSHSEKHPRNVAKETRIIQEQVQCVNNDQWVFSQNALIDCEEVHRNEFHRAALCPLADVHTNCPIACGVCCEDDQDFTFQTFDLISSPPALVMQSCERMSRSEWCRLPRVKQGCPKTCDDCQLRSYVDTPSESPSHDSTIITGDPTKNQIFAPTTKPSDHRLGRPSVSPSKLPTLTPSASPSSRPSEAHSESPTSIPTKTPTAKPSIHLSERPSISLSRLPTLSPSSSPTSRPTATSSPSSSHAPSTTPSAKPSRLPTLTPSVMPSSRPTTKPSVSPTSAPTKTPTAKPSIHLSERPSASASPSRLPTLTPSVTPTLRPTVTSSPSSSQAPTTTPTAKPSRSPTLTPSVTPTFRPTVTPSVSPTSAPTKAPTLKLPIHLSERPSASPSRLPTLTPSSSPTSWRFLVIADTHLFAQFSWNNPEENRKMEGWRKITKALTFIRANYGGELVLLPGDQASYGKIALQTFIDHFGGNLSPQESIYRAAVNCHKTARALFGEVGYGTILATIGDHEIGGNNGFGRIGNKNSKVLTHQSHRRAFGDGYNRNGDGKFLFDQWFGGVPSRPMGTEYENTSHAYIRRNALFITVDAFELVGDGTRNYLDRENGLGGEGAVTCTVSGEHLDWFEKILSYGKDSPDIDHIFVQAHLPIIQPVRKVNTSGQFFDRAAESDFWKLMNEYGVDIYFAGDVHSNTATKSSYDDGSSNLVQIIVSRGKRFNNFLTLDVSEDIIDVKIYNEYGEEWRFNAQYEEYGHLRIDKSSETTEISSSGMLELLDVNSKILAFDFQKIFPLGTRQVLAMSDGESLMVKEVMIRDELCKESMFNKGSFGAQYDAQLCNIDLVEGRYGNGGGLVGLFNEQSRFGVFASGPFNGGEIVSLGMWIRTTEAKKRMVLVHYGNYWGYAAYRIDKKDHFTLILDNGVPVVYTQPLIQLRPEDTMNLADGSWHHVAISMPRKSCKMSELEMYVDGQKIANTVVSRDRHVFFTTSGKLSLGGFGYSNRGYEDALRGAGPFIGAMDDFSSFARPLHMRTDFPLLYPLTKHEQTLCDKSRREDYVIRDPFNDCHLECLKADWCFGYERSWFPEDKCVLFKVRPKLGGTRPGTTCRQAGW